jgi:RNA polymerase primary sigma factor
LPVLDRDQEVALASRARDGDVAARQALVQHNLRFVVKLARSLRPRRVSLEELVAEGNVGLARAAASFDPDKGVRFTTYAAWWVRDSIQQYLAGQGGSVTLPEKKHRLVRRARAARARLSHEHGRVPRPDEVAAACGSSVEELRRVEQAAGASSPLEHYLPDRRNGEHVPENVVERHTRAHVAGTLNRVLGELPHKERDAIRLYFGLGGGEPRTFQEIGPVVGLGKEGARVAFHRGLRRLRQRLDELPHPA